MRYLQFTLAIIFLSICVTQLALATETVTSNSEKSNLLERCDITAKQNQTGSVTIYSKLMAKKTIVDKTVRNLKDIDFRFGHAHTNPWISFKNNNKYGVYAVALGFYLQDTKRTCSRDPKDYQAILFCRGLVPGIGVGAGESGRLECSMKAKAATEHDFCIIGFTPEFESAGAGLAKAMDALGMCE